MSTRKIPGQTKYDDINLERGIILDIEFEQWANKVWFYENSNALGNEVSLKDWWAVIRREIVFGLTVGVALATVGLARLAVGRELGERLIGDQWASVSLAVGVSLIVVVLWGVTLGSMLPFLMRGLGADPAASSTPFVATVVDITGLIIYFLLATAILG